MEENTYAFDGIEEVVNFYNAVLASPDTVEEPASFLLGKDARMPTGSARQADVASLAEKSQIS